jgi:phosphoribosylamine--glycine ligase
MNSGFFATAEGVKVIEFNARFGDPECINIMSLLAASWPEVMERICSGTLTDADVRLQPEASLVLYLVSPEYALRDAASPPPRSYEFELDEKQMEDAGTGVFFASAERTSGTSFRTLGTSRALALATTAPTLARAHSRIADCAASVAPLQWRHDVGDETYLNRLSKLVEQPAGGEARPLLR